VAAAVAAAAEAISTKRAADEMAPASEPRPAAPKAKIYCDWTKHKSSAGLEYYYNRATKASAWEEPPAYTVYLGKIGQRGRKPSTNDSAPSAKRSKLTDAERAVLDAIKEEQDRDRAQKKLEIAAAKAEKERIKLETGLKREEDRLAKAKEKMERDAKKLAEAEERKV
jgi:hypothetical protein